MMNFTGRIKDMLTNLREEDEYDEYQTQDVEYVPRQRSSYDDYIEETEDYKQIKPEVSYDIIIAHPKTVDDAPDIVNSLRVNCVCVINLEGVDLGIAQRIADFLGGAAYAMNGAIERVNENIFVMAPLGVNIKDKLKFNEKSASILSWVAKAARF